MFSLIILEVMLLLVWVSKVSVMRLRLPQNFGSTIAFHVYKISFEQLSNFELSTRKKQWMMLHRLSLKKNNPSCGCDSGRLFSSPHMIHAAQFCPQPHLFLLAREFFCAFRLLVASGCRGSGREAKESGEDAEADAGVLQALRLGGPERGGPARRRAGGAAAPPGGRPRQHLRRRRLQPGRLHPRLAPHPGRSTAAPRRVRRGRGRGGGHRPGRARRRAPAARRRRPRLLPPPRRCLPPRRRRARRGRRRRHRGRAPSSDVPVRRGAPGGADAGGHQEAAGLLQLPARRPVARPAPGRHRRARRRAGHGLAVQGRAGPRGDGVGGQLQRAGAHRRRGRRPADGPAGQRARRRAAVRAGDGARARRRRRGGRVQPARPGRRRRRGGAGHGGAARGGAGLRRGGGVLHGFLRGEYRPALLGEIGPS